MSDMHTDLVIRISTSESESDPTAAKSEKTEDSQLITELRHCLQPGVEIALVFPGYMAITSILWLSELQRDGSLRAGVRLLGVSALPGERPEPAAAWDEAPRRAVPVRATPPIISHLL